MERFLSTLVAIESRGTTTTISPASS